MKHFISKFWARLSGPKRGVMAIASGALIGQLLLVGATPVLSRIYSPSTFGLFSLVIAIAAVLGPVATLKFDSALTLPQNDDEARRLLRLSLASAVSVALLTTLVVWLLIQFTLLSALSQLPFAALWIGSGVLVSATFATLSQAALRQRSYSTIGKRSITQSGVTVGGQLALGLATQAPVGLLGGFMLGRLAGHVPMYRASRALFQPPESSSYRAVFSQYWRFPVVFTPSGLLNALGSQLPLLLISAWFTAETVGEFGMAQRLVFIPLTLLGASMGQVFGAEVSRRYREGLGSNRAVYLRSSGRMAVVGSVVTLAVLTMAPWLLPLILGEGWGQTGYFAQAMAVSMGLGLVASPLSRVYTIYQCSLASVLVDGSRIVLVLAGAAFVHLTDSSALQATWVLYGAQAINYVVTWLYGLRIVSRDAS